MDFFETVDQRHSVRRYKPLDVDQAMIDRILDTINLAPSAGDLQGYEVIVVRDQTRKDSLANAAYGQSSVSEAPVVMVFCADHLMSGSKYGERGATLYAVQDATIAAAYCQLAATAQGLATVWVGAFNPSLVSEVLQMPDKVTPVAMIPIGHPTEVPARTPRRNLDDLVRMERF